MGVSLVKAAWNSLKINCFCRTHSLREDACSELQGVISVEGGHVPESQASSFTGRGAMAR